MTSSIGPGLLVDLRICRGWICPRTQQSQGLSPVPRLPRGIWKELIMMDMDESHLGLVDIGWRFHDRSLGYEWCRNWSSYMFLSFSWQWLRCESMCVNIGKLLRFLSDRLCVEVLHICYCLHQWESNEWHNFQMYIYSNMFYFHPYLGKVSILTNIFPRGWNHQPDIFVVFFRSDPSITCIPVCVIPGVSNAWFHTFMDVWGISIQNHPKPTWYAHTNLNRNDQKTILNYFGAWIPKNMVWKKDFPFSTIGIFGQICVHVSFFGSKFSFLRYVRRGFDQHPSLWCWSKSQVIHFNHQFHDQSH